MTSFCGLGWLGIDNQVHSLVCRSDPRTDILLCFAGVIILPHADGNWFQRPSKKIQIENYMVIIDDWHRFSYILRKWQTPHFPSKSCNGCPTDKWINEKRKEGRKTIDRRKRKDSKWDTKLINGNSAPALCKQLVITVRLFNGFLGKCDKVIVIKQRKWRVEIKWRNFGFT